MPKARRLSINTLSPAKTSGVPLTTRISGSSTAGSKPPREPTRARPMPVQCLSIVQKTGTLTNTCSVACGMTSQGTRYGAAHTAFRRSLETRSIAQAELAMREMGRVGLLDALDYCALLALERSERFEPAACRWLSVLLSECGSLTLDDVQLAAACLGGLPGGDADAIRETLRALVKRRHRLRGQ
jgi:hypothetical protein